MQNRSDTAPWRPGPRVVLWMLAAVALAALLVPGTLQTLLDDRYMPHAHCYWWETGLVGLHLVSDSLIGLAYLAISITLVVMVRKAPEPLPFNWMFVAFGTFIVACGATHFMEVVTLYSAVYWMSGTVKGLTAVVSVATAIALPPLVPKAFALVREARMSSDRKARLEVSNQTLLDEIAERERAEAALRDSEERFRSLVQSANDAIILSDGQGRIDSWNAGARAMFGYEEEEVVGQPIAMLMPERYQEGHRAGMERMYATGDSKFVGRTIELHGRRKNGEEFPIELSLGSWTTAAGERYFSAIIRDVTERRAAEERQAELLAALSRAASEWKLTFDAIESPIMILDRTGTVVRMNRSALDLAEARQYERVLGRPVDRIAMGQPWEEAAKLVQEVVESGKAATSQIRVGSYGKVWDLAATLGGESDAGADRTVLVARDITRMVDLLESLRRSETMSALGRLVVGVAHEVRNPLFIISATLDALEEELLGRDERFGEYAGILRRQKDRLAKLMADLLEFGKPVSLDLQPITLDEIFGLAIEACTPEAEQARVGVETAIDERLEPAVVDRSRMVQVFQNLIENAIQHSPAGAVVRIEAVPVEEDGRLWAECRVLDSGPGFRAKDIPRLFEPFFTRREKGTGLGLSVVQRIVEQHGGEVQARNRPGGGAIMRVLIPMDRDRFPAPSGG